jgi:hypothetical protein
VTSVRVRRFFLRRPCFVGLRQAPRLGELLQQLASLVGAVFLNHLLDAHEPFLGILVFDRHSSRSVIRAGAANYPKLHNPD